MAPYPNPCCRDFAENLVGVLPTNTNSSDEGLAIKKALPPCSERQWGIDAELGGPTKPGRSETPLPGSEFIRLVTCCDSSVDAESRRGRITRSRSARPADDTPTATCCPVASATLKEGEDSRQHT